MQSNMRTGRSQASAGRCGRKHPAPFGLKYVEIGNEDGPNPLYGERYMPFDKAIKARYPEIQIMRGAA